jgi:hypothetical protein
LTFFLQIIAKQTMSQGQDKAKAVKEEVDQVVGIMHDNINKVMERGERLDSLQTKTGKCRRWFDDGLILIIRGFAAGSFTI